MTCGDFSTLWWTRVKPRLQPDWAETVEKYHLPAIQAAFGALPIQEVSPEQVDIWYMKLAQTRSGLASKILGTAKALFQSAVAWRYIADSPAAKITPLRATRGRTTRFTSTVRSALLRQANPRLYPYLRMASEAPGRRRSMLSLKVQDVDFFEPAIIYRDTKNRDDVRIPISLELAREIKDWIGPSPEPTAYVLPRYRADSLSRAFKRLAKRVGIPDARYHDQRHDFATRLTEAGVNQKIIMAVLGHRDPRTTLRYQHPSLTAIQAALQQAKKENP